MEQATAPGGLMDAIWPVIEPALSPELIGAILVTLFGTHLVKILAEHWLPDVTDTPAHWRAFCATASVAIGSASGLVTWWLTSATWPIVPIVALGSGPVWRLLQVLIPNQRIVDAFLTATDRKYRRKQP